MGLAKNIMGGGQSALAAQTDFMAQINSGISAAGTTQATATALFGCANLVSTVGASAGVQIYNGLIGDSQWVFNDGGANTLTVYPPTGSKFNNLATNTGISLPANSNLLVLKVTSTRWLAMLSA